MEAAMGPEGTSGEGDRETQIQEQQRENVNNWGHLNSIDIHFCPILFHRAHCSSLFPSSAEDPSISVLLFNFSADSLFHS